MGTLRRWLVVLSLMFWQGGFMFYGGVVVPVGSEVLGSDTDQGWITRKVTDYLNAAGAVALAVWGVGHPGRPRPSPEAAATSAGGVGFPGCGPRCARLAPRTARRIPRPGGAPHPRPPPLSQPPPLVSYDEYTSVGGGAGVGVLDAACVAGRGRPCRRSGS